MSAVTKEIKPQGSKSTNISERFSYVTCVTTDLRIRHSLLQPVLRDRFTGTLKKQIKKEISLLTLGTSNELHSGVLVGFTKTF